MWVREGCEKQALHDKTICGACLGEVSGDGGAERQQVEEADNHNLHTHQDEWETSSEEEKGISKESPTKIKKCK